MSRDAASLLEARAGLYRTIRDYFAVTGAIEVDPPVLGQYATTDVNLASLPVRTVTGERWLQTSPEFFLKRLLCRCPRDLYALTHAFRDEPEGRRHRPEFTLLEWYRLGYSTRELADDVGRLVRRVLPGVSIQATTYAELFDAVLAVDPHSADRHQLNDLVATHTSYDGELERDQALDLLMSQCVEPTLPDGLVFVHDYPAEMAALARLETDAEGRQVAGRFEVFLDRVELANGYRELADPQEQARRFARDNEIRRQRGLAEIVPDQDLLLALHDGLPDCAGIALGIDRLLMRLTGCDDIGALSPLQ